VAPWQWGPCSLFLGLLVLLLGSIALPYRASGPLQAGTAVRMDIDDLVGGSDLILEGRVLSTRAFPTAGGHIETEYILEVDRTFEGEDMPVRSIRIPGGILSDGTGMVIPGMPRVSAGEEVLLFLTRESSAGIRMPVGLAQGKFELVRDRNGVKSLIGERKGLAVISPASGALVEGADRVLFEYAQVVARIEAARASLKAIRRLPR